MAKILSMKLKESTLAYINGDRLVPENVKERHAELIKVTAKTVVTFLHIQGEPPPSKAVLEAMMMAINNAIIAEWSEGKE